MIHSGLNRALDDLTSHPPNISGHTVEIPARINTYVCLSDSTPALHLRLNLRQSGRLVLPSRTVVKKDDPFEWMGPQKDEEQENMPPGGVEPPDPSSIQETVSRDRGRPPRSTAA